MVHHAKNLTTIRFYGLKLFGVTKRGNRESSSNPPMRSCSNKTLIKITSLIASQCNCHHVKGLKHRYRLLPLMR